MVLNELKFNIGDTVRAVKRIERVDKRDCLEIGEFATVRAVMNLPDSQIVDLTTKRGNIIADIVYFNNGNDAPIAKV